MGHHRTIGGVTSLKAATGTMVLLWPRYSTSLTKTRFSRSSETTLLFLARVYAKHNWEAYRPTCDHAMMQDSARCGRFWFDIE